MYTEILRIIEGGLAKDSKKVYSYAKLLADKLVKDGDGQMAKMIINTLGDGPATTVTMDELLTKPVDQESRLSIVDVTAPSHENETIILTKPVENMIDHFIKVIKHQGALAKHGVDTQNTLLLYGKPGCGKTTIAKYISLQTGLPLVTARFDAIVSSLLGNTAKNIRKIFDFADNKPCILFLDEFDAIAKARDDQYELGELKRVINSLLQNIDSFAKHNVLIAATNHAELLDKAIWRRFNTVIEVGLPAGEEIGALLSSYTTEVKNDFTEDKKKMDRLVKLLEGKSPSDIRSIANNAKAQAIINDREGLAFDDLLVEIFQFNNHGASAMDKMAEFLNENGMAQATIADKMNVSLRQIRNFLSKQS
jgi:SpoVK/Ycf46/Vps4 family AAA+-type ATPase